MNTRQAALDAVHGLYCKRACGMTPGGAQTTYTGGMDLQGFVDSCPAPSSHDLAMHQACWAEMRRMFDQAWAEFSMSGVLGLRRGR